MGMTILYLTGESLFREVKGSLFRKGPRILTEFPGSIQNEKEGQMHSLVPNPVFPETTPRTFKTWEDFISSKTPTVVRLNDKSLVVCPDNDSFPLGPNDEKDQKEYNLIRDNARGGMLQEALHRGRDQAERSDNSLASTMIMFWGTSAAFATVVVGILFILGKIGQ